MRINFVSLIFFRSASPLRLVLIVEIKHARIQALALRTKTVMIAPDQLRIINKNIFDNFLTVILK